MKNFDSLFAKGTLFIYKKKDILTSPATYNKCLYQIKKGYIYGYSRTRDNKKRIQSILKPGDIFPVLWGNENAPNRFYIEALTNVTVSLIDKNVFFEKVYSDKNLMQELIQALTKYLGAYVERVENLELETLPEKVIGRLLHFAASFGIKKGEKIFIQIPLTHTFIAESINVSRENVSRELTKLKKENLIAFQGKNLIILNSKKLAEKI